MDKGDEIGQILTRQHDDVAQLFLLHRDHRSRALPHARGKLEDVHRRRHVGGIQGWSDIAADAIDRVANDAALLHEDQVATM